jgi:hypothetical protein
VEAPAGFNVNVCPLQMVPLLIVIVGLVKTVTNDTTVFTAAQPLVLLPVTEYEVVPGGVTKKLLPLTEYVDAPEGRMVKGFPLQIVPLLTEMVGEVITESVHTTLFTEAHPMLLVPVTMNEVLLAGVTIKELPVML